MQEFPSDRSHRVTAESSAVGPTRRLRCEAIKTRHSRQLSKKTAAAIGSQVYLSDVLEPALHCLEFIFRPMLADSLFGPE